MAFIVKYKQTFVVKDETWVLVFKKIIDEDKDNHIDKISESAIDLIKNDFKITYKYLMGKKLGINFKTLVNPIDAKVFKKPKKIRDSEIIAILEKHKFGDDWLFSNQKIYFNFDYMDRITQIITEINKQEPKLRYVIVIRFMMNVLKGILNLKKGDPNIENYEKLIIIIFDNIGIDVISNMEKFYAQDDIGLELLIIHGLTENNTIEYLDRGKLLLEFQDDAYIMYTFFKQFGNNGSRMVQVLNAIKKSYSATSTDKTLLLS